MKSAFDYAVDILDPPAWEAKDRNPLGEHQIPPPSPFDFWLLEAGRGAGKTEACARYYASYMHQVPGCRGRIIAPTFGDAVAACIEGPSGLQAIDPDVRWNPSAAGGAKVSWPNGSEALVIGTPAPKDVDRLRAGGNRELDWWEEMAANAQLKGDRPDNGAWDQAQLGLRLGHPHSIASTTPRNTRAYREVRKLADHIRHATIFDNAANLPKSFLEKMKKRYEGSRLGRQELYGELLTDVAGALWTERVISAGRIADPEEVPDLVRSVVAVDPAATSGPNADDTGIVVVGLGVDWEVYVLADRTCHLDPDGWGQRAVRAYEKHQADMIVAEINNGGEMVEHVIATVDPHVHVKTVHASRGKATRAQPIASLYGNPPKREPRVHHVGAFPELEDQLTTWVPGEADSPDRLDALVWGVTELLLEETEDVELEEDYEPVSIGFDV